MIGFETHGAFDNNLIGNYSRAFLIPGVLTLIIFYVLDLYDTKYSIPTPRTIGRFIIGAVMTSVVYALFFYLFPKFGISPKTNLVIFSIVFIGLTMVWRRTFFHLFAKTFARKIAFIGTDKEIEDLKTGLKEHRHIGTNIGTFETFESYENSNLHADVLVVAKVIGIQNTHKIAKIKTPVMTTLGAFEEMFAKTPLSLISPEEGFLMASRNDEGGWYFLYRGFEIFIASLVLIITSPLSIIAIVSRLIEDGSPIFIRQKRIGKNGTIFTLYKFRSMKALAPDGSAEISGAQWAEKQDPRITPVGKILRKTHIDEIPQMWNIICGDLALVGPRAERPEFVEKLEKEIPYYNIRHSVKPGFTGWAQIKYRYARTVDDSREKLEYDLYYLRYKNPLLDLGILTKTIQIIFTH